jgi:histidinol-phosphate aminotransferase
MTNLPRPNIRAMAGYAAGEQPQDGSFIKLNTNENPYPPSPKVLEAILEVLGSDRLRKYPDPLGRRFCQVAGGLLGVEPAGILIGNGSDDILTILTRAFVPEGGLVVSPTPSYLLYRSLAEIQGARYEVVPYSQSWQLPGRWPFPAANLTFVCTPNSPSGTTLSLDYLKALAAQLEGPLVVDEAYVDFAETNALALAGQGNVVIIRTLSKSYSLAGVRFGFTLASPELVRELIKVKDSYNCDVLSQAAACAALMDQDYFRSTRTRILATRNRLALALPRLGFDVCPSQANFLWCRRSDRPVLPIQEELKRLGVLVRYMNYASYGDGLRISIGSDPEIDVLLEKLARIV